MIKLFFNLIINTSAGADNPCINTKSKTKSKAKSRAKVGHISTTIQDKNYDFT